MERTVRDELKELAERMHGYGNQSVADVLRAADILRAYSKDGDLPCAACIIDELADSERTKEDGR